MEALYSGIKCTDMRIAEDRTCCVTHNTTIAFSLTSILISLYIATKVNDIHFNQLCQEEYSRLLYKKSYFDCRKEIFTQDIIKRFHYEEGKYMENCVRFLSNQVLPNNSEKAPGHSDAFSAVIHGC